MSADFGKAENPTKKGPVRYFGDGGNKNSETKPKVKAESDGFDGEVIQVNERPRHRQWKNKSQLNKANQNGNKFRSNFKQRVQTKIDPHALDRHTRKFSFMIELSAVKYFFFYLFRLPFQAVAKYPAKESKPTISKRNTDGRIFTMNLLPNKRHALKFF